MNADRPLIRAIRRVLDWLVSLILLGCVAFILYILALPLLRSCFAVSGAVAGPWGGGDTPMTRGLWILGGEEDSIDRSFTVLVRVICRCLRAPPHRARWRVS